MNRQDRFEELVARELYGDLSPEEAVELEALSQGDPALSGNRNAIKETDEILKWYGEKWNGKKTRSEIPVITPWANRRPFLYAAAALIVCIGGFLFLQRKSSTELTFAAGCQPEKSNAALVISHDCTIEHASVGGSIYVQSSGTIHLEENSGSVILWLKRGKVHITEKGSDSVRLTVYVDSMRVTPIGTEYEIVSEAKRVTVQVITGSVRVEESAAFLSPGLAKDLEKSKNLSDLRETKLNAGQKAILTTDDGRVARINAKLNEIEADRAQASAALKKIQTGPGLQLIANNIDHGYVEIKLKDGRRLMAKILSRGTVWELLLKNGNALSVPAEEVDSVQGSDQETRNK